MLGINTRVVSQHLTMNHSPKPVVQRKRKVYEEKRTTIDEEVRKLSSTRFITKKNPTRLANTMLVRKATIRWNMCVDFTNMNVAYPKDLYPYPDINHLIDESLGYHTLNFVDIYSRYNKIRMTPPLK